MTSKPPPTDPADVDLHARGGHDPSDRRKRKSEARVAQSVAGAMAGEVVAAIAGKAKKDRSAD